MKPSEQIEKRANEMVGSGERPNHLHANLSALIEYLDELYDKGILKEKWDGRIG